MTAVDRGGFAFDDVIRAAEARMVARCGLVPAPIPAELARCEGALRGAPVAIETRAWASPGDRPVAYARFVSMRGAGVDVGNVVCLPDARHALPILGADLVALTPRAAMIAADLSPTLPAGPLRDAQLAAFARVRAGHPALPPGGELPPYCADFFSPHHLYTRFGASEREVACRAFHDVVDAFVDLACGAREAVEPSLVGAARATQAAYAEAHVADEKGLEVLARAFGRPWAVRYVTEVMFPVLAEAKAVSSS